MNENRKTKVNTNNKILTAIAIASLFIGSSKIMAIETNFGKFIRSDRTDAGTNSPRYCCRPVNEPIIGASILKKVLPMELPPTYTVNSR